MIIGPNGKEREAEVVLSDDAFVPTAFRPPKLFRARFLPMNEKRLNIGQGEIGEGEGGRVCVAREGRGC